jgi:hypothetical protein
LNNNRRVILLEKINFAQEYTYMKEIIEKLKAACAVKNPNYELVVTLLKELRDHFKANLTEPGLVKMIRLAYEDIEANGAYTFMYLEESNAQENIAYFIDLLADYSNKYNREELQDIRNLMEGITPEVGESEEESV